jgi:chromosomal replication initiator protein
MYLIRKELDHSFEKIGEIFGGRNHTTVLHAYNSISKRLKFDERLLNAIKELKKVIGA